ncbi:MAG: ABC transporter permease [Magnetospiraceae bacterium]
MSDFTEGVSYFRRGLLAEAESSFRLCLRENPDHFRARLRLGDLLLRLHRNAEAQKILIEATLIAPDHAKAFFDLGRAEVRLRHQDAAAAALSRVIELRPHWHQPYYHLGRLRQTQEDLTGAAEMYAQGLAIKPEDIPLLLAQTEVLGALGDYDGAVAAAEAALAADPRNARAALFRRRFALLRDFDPDRVPDSYPKKYHVPDRVFHNVARIDWRAALESHTRVVRALMLRETRTRFGRHRMGMLWAVIEPGLFIAVIYLIFTVFGRQPPNGMTLLEMLLTGIVPWLLFVNTRAAVAKAATMNRALLMFPNVSPFDLVIARALLELSISLSVFAVMIGGLYLAGIGDGPHQIPEIFSALMLLWLIGVGLGMASGTIALYFPSFENFFAALTRLLFLTSGIFFVVKELPQDVREVALLNPLLYAIEILRDGYFKGYSLDGITPTYCIVFAGGMVFLGLLLDRAYLRARLFSQ